MKKTIILMGILCGLSINAQWSLIGNSGTTPGINFLGTTDNKDLVFKTNGNERMRIFQNGNIFLGDPFWISYTGIDTSRNLTFAGNASLYIKSNEDSFKIIDNSTNFNYIRIAASDEYESAIYLQEDDGKVVIGSRGSAYCTTCTGYKLFVKDGIKTEKVKVEIAAENGWADYVFKKDYKLMPLYEVESYINTNGHLPEVPSTEEAIKNGIELKEMNILLLKKIEELTLHAIEQNKRIEELEKSKK